LEGGINKQRGSNVGNAVVVMQQLDELWADRRGIPQMACWPHIT
jgi:hypothetical protein